MRLANIAANFSGLHRVRILVSIQEINIHNGVVVMDNNEALEAMKAGKHVERFGVWFKWDSKANCVYMGFLGEKIAVDWFTERYFLKEFKGATFESLQYHQ